MWVLQIYRVLMSISLKLHGAWADWQGDASQFFVNRLICRGSQKIRSADVLVLAHDAANRSFQRGC
jgi:hypothetical protein